MFTFAQIAYLKIQHPLQAISQLPFSERLPWSCKGPWSLNADHRGVSLSARAAAQRKPSASPNKSPSESSLQQRFGTICPTRYWGAWARSQGRTPSHFNLTFCISLSHPFSLQKTSHHALCTKQAGLLFKTMKIPGLWVEYFLTQKSCLLSPRAVFLPPPGSDLCPRTIWESEHSTCLCIGSFCHWRNPQETLEQELNFLIK